MAISDVRKNVLEIIQEVERKLGITRASTTLTQTKFTTTLLDFLNDVVDEIADFGDWPQMFQEVTVTAASSVGTYEISASAAVQNVYEISWGDDVAPLEVRTVEDIRRLQRLASYGTPRQFAIVDVSGVNPRFRVYPIPNQSAIDAASTNGGVFDCAIYVKPPMYTTADVSAVPAFPSRMLVQGVYAKALAEEAGGEATGQFQAAYAEYIRMRREAYNRLTADTGTDMYVTPTGSRYA